MTYVSRSVALRVFTPAYLNNADFCLYSLAPPTLNVNLRHTCSLPERPFHSRVSLPPSCLRLTLRVQDAATNGVPAQASGAQEGEVKEEEQEVGQETDMEVSARAQTVEDLGYLCRVACDCRFRLYCIVCPSRLSTLFVLLTT